MTKLPHILQMVLATDETGVKTETDAMIGKIGNINQDRGTGGEIGADQQRG